MDVPADLSGLTDRSLVRVVIVSYGVLHGGPPPGDALTVDLTTALRNPPEDPDVRDRMVQMTGLDKEARDYVLATPGARRVVERTVGRIEAALTYHDPRGQYVMVHVYCQGGRHRSVAIAEETAAWLRADGINTEVEHRDVTKPVVQR